MSKFIKHTACEVCGSSDGLAVYDDGHAYCFVHGERTTNRRGDPIDKPTEVPMKMLPIAETFQALPDRRISEATARRYGVSFQPNQKVQHAYPYFDKDGRHIANKLRLQGPGKNFICQGLFGQATLFGQQLFPPGSAKQITITEGECDALAAYEMQGSKFPVVSIHGAASASRNCADQFEYLNSFDQIVVCFDKDEGHVGRDGTVSYPGQEAALKVAELFPIGKVRILTLMEHKDANDYLAAGQTKQFMDEWWRAPTFTPAGLKLGKDMWDEIIKPKNYETVSYPWESLNKMTYGIRLSEVVLLTGSTGDGKTSLLKEIEHHLLSNTQSGLGLLHLEEPNSDTALGLMSITANKPLHLPDVREGVTDDDLRAYFDTTVNTERVVIWDHFGSNSIIEVLSKIRHMSALGCKYIVLDHLSILVSDQSGDERKQLDEISTKLKTLCMELNIGVIAVIHLNRNGEIRSSAGPEQLANIVMQLHRDKEDPDPWRRNVTKVVIKKNRFSGRTGPSSYFWYNNDTGRLEELNQEQIAAYEAGGKDEGHW